MSDDETLAALREKKETAETAGLDTFAEHIEQQIAEREGAALSDHVVDEEPISVETIDDDDLAALEERKEDAEAAGFDNFAEHLERKIEGHPDYEPTDQGGDDEGKSAAALEEEHRAALAEADEELQEHTRAALTAEDAVHMTDRKQPAAQYVFDTYGVDPRDFEDEYELREELKSREWQADPAAKEDEVSAAEAALSIGDRNRLSYSDVPAELFVKKEYGLDPSDYDGIEELRAAIHTAGGYSDDDRDAPSRNTAFSDPDDWV